MWYDTGAQVGALMVARSEVDALYEGLEKNSVDRYSKLRGIVLQQDINR
jgi:hypothetical protein